MTPRPMHAAGHARRERGASLFIVVVLLLTVGLMTLTAFYLARGQYQLVGNVQNFEQAFNQSEAVTATAEAWLADPVNSKSTAFTSTSTTQAGLYRRGTLTADVKSMTWSSSNSIPMSMNWSTTTGVQSVSGRYLIESLATNVQLPGNSMQVSQRASGGCRSVNLFRVVSKSDGVRGASRMIETTYATDAC